MKIASRTYCAGLLVLVGFSARVMADSQEVTLNYEMSDNSNQLLMVSYDVDGGRGTTGLGFRLHFNSDLVEIKELKSYMVDSSLGVQIQPDTDDYDIDPSTDFYINAAWVDLIGEWPREQSLPAPLYQVNFDTLRPGSKDLFNITVSETAVGYTFVSRID